MRWRLGTAMAVVAIFAEGEPALAQPSAPGPQAESEQAQPATAWPAPYLRPWYVPPLVDIEITEPGVELRVLHEHADPARDAPLVFCVAPGCRTALWADRYKIHVTETAHTLAGSRVIETRGPARIIVDPDTRTHRYLGLAMGIAGPVLVLLGAGLLTCGGGCERSRLDAGVTTLVGGIAITPVGWVMYGTSSKPEVEVRHPDGI